MCHIDCDISGLSLVTLEISSSFGFVYEPCQCYCCCLDRVVFFYVKNFS